MGSVWQMQVTGGGLWRVYWPLVLAFVFWILTCLVRGHHGGRHSCLHGFPVAFHSFSVAVMEHKGKGNFWKSLFCLRIPEGYTLWWGGRHRKPVAGMVAWEASWALIYKTQTRSGEREHWECCKALKPQRPAQVMNSLQDIGTSWTSTTNWGPRVKYRSLLCHILFQTTTLTLTKWRLSETRSPNKPIFP